MLKTWLAHPLTGGLDIDDPRTTHVRLTIIQQKKFLRRFTKNEIARLPYRCHVVKEACWKLWCANPWQRSVTFFVYDLTYYRERFNKAGGNVRKGGSLDCRADRCWIRIGFSVQALAVRQRH
jgi:hypothetical protein